MAGTLRAIYIVAAGACPALGYAGSAHTFAETGRPLNLNRELIPAHGLDKPDTIHKVPRRFLVRIMPCLETGHRPPEGVHCPSYACVLRNHSGLRCEKLLVFRLLLEC